MTIDPKGDIYSSEEDDVYVCGSFNNWFPIKMYKIHDILSMNLE